MPTGPKLEKKNAYFRKLVQLVENSPLALIIEVDHVGSRVFQHIRMALRGKAVILMGKNTMMRTALRQRIEETDDEGLKNLVAAIQGNMGFIFLDSPEHLQFVRNTLDEFVIPAIAKAGTIAPVDVHLPAGPCGLEPSQTSYFQAMNIGTKIVKGMIEILSDVHLVKINERVSLSAQALLAKLGLKPFEYKMVVRQVFQEGSVFDAAVLDITDQVLITKFLNGVGNVAALSREIGIPTEASLPHMMKNAFKNMVGLVVDLDFSFAQADEIKAILKDPEALAAMKNAATTTAAPGGNAAPAAAPAAAAVVEEEEEEMDFDLFD